MNRRETVLALLSFDVAPLAAQSQQRTTPLVGFLSARSPADTLDLVAAFRRGLVEGGFVEGKNLTIEYRWARGLYDRLPALATELVRLPLAVLVSTGGDPAALAAKAATSTTPIVFAVGGDPVRTGLVASYNRPGGNATGVTVLTATMEAKRVGILHELVPQATAIGFLVDSNFPLAEAQASDAEEAAHSLGLKLEVFRVNSDREIDAAFKAIVQRPILALATAGSPFFDTRRDKLVELAARHAVPTMYHFRQYVVAGGLISYGVDLLDAYWHVGLYAARILKGTKPADLPVLQPTKFELVLNLKTARMLGLTIQQGFLARVDEVID
jgi:putative ABC transport system substrate-binding protein